MIREVKLVSLTLCYQCIAFLAISQYFHSNLNKIKFTELYLKSEPES